MPFRDYRKACYLEKLVDAQHYGLPTRLLDWTSSPLKALYFSVDNHKLDDMDGVIYGLTPLSW
ncbi:MAG: FRG domain-containing protein [Pseudomonadota bacterium]